MAILLKRLLRGEWAARASNPFDGRFGPTAWLIVLGLTLTGAIAVATATAIDKFREDAITAGLKGLDSSAHLLARHFDQQFQDFAVLQNEIVSELESRQIDSPDAFRSQISTLAVHKILHAKASDLTDVAGANVFDADGILINSTHQWPVPDIRVADRAYFQRLRSNPQLLSDIDLIRSRFAASPAIVFARRISGPHGEFLGVATRAIPREKLETFFASAELGNEASIAMHRRDGILLARFPYVEAMVGRNFKNGSADQQAVFEQPRFSARLDSPVDGKDRLIASRMLAGYPLIVVATKTVDSALVPWRRQTKFFIGVSGASILLIGLTLYLVFRGIMGQITLQKGRLDTAVNNMSHGLLLFDAAERLIVCNDKYIAMYGLSPDVVRPGCSLRELIHHRKATGSFEGDVEHYCDQVLRTRNYSHTMVVETSDHRMIRVKNEPVSGGGWVATHEDVTEQSRAEERIAYLAHYDSLTDLPNRILFHEQVERKLSEMPADAKFAVLYVDLDEFKSINDSLGHHVGDELLRAVASRFKSCVGSTDLVARLGGDEFAIIKSDVSAISELAVLAEEIRHVMQAPFDCLGQLVWTDASIGIAVAPDDGTHLDELLKNADLAMYAAKADGRRTHRFFAAEMNARMKARHALELDLKRTWNEGGFQIHYQPVVDLNTNGVTGCEALLRWSDPERGMISPAEFIPLAEESGLINELGEWVLTRACADAADWPRNMILAVNVSPIQFRSRTLAMRIAAALANSGLPPNRLELEITEAVLIRDDEEALAILHQLRELGVRIALDDFGTGYSSLSYLGRFPFDKIKIDRSFISDLTKADGSLPIVQAVVSMASARRMATTAEGVETEQQRELLRELGCCQMQGYLFSPPVPVEQLRRLLGFEATVAVA